MYNVDFHLSDMSHSSVLKLMAFVITFLTLDYSTTHPPTPKTNHNKVQKNKVSHWWLLLFLISNIKYIPEWILEDKVLLNRIP